MGVNVGDDTWRNARQPDHLTDGYANCTSMGDVLAKTYVFEGEVLAAVLVLTSMKIGVGNVSLTRLKEVDVRLGNDALGMVWWVGGRTVGWVVVGAKQAYMAIYCTHASSLG